MSSKPRSSNEKLLGLVLALAVVAGTIYWYLSWYLIFKVATVVILAIVVKTAVRGLRDTEHSPGKHGSTSFGTRVVAFGLWLLPCLAVVGALHGIRYDLTQRGAVFTGIELMLVTVASAGLVLLHAPDQLLRKLFEKSPERR